MKKILLCAALLSLVAVSCKKKQSNPSTTVTASFPTITFTNGPFFSIPVGGIRPTALATAYDSFYKKSLAVVLIDSTVNTLVPGLYLATATATNLYGYVSNSTYYVAVTNISSSMDLSGNWYISSGTDSNVTMVQKLATGLYSTSNLTGANVHFASTNPLTSTLFAVINDTTLAFNADLLAASSNSIPSGVLNMKIHILGDTLMSYIINGTDTVVYNKN